MLYEVITRSIVFGSWLGWSLDGYDLVLMLLVIPLISKLFFPSGDTTIGLIATFAAYVINVVYKKILVPHEGSPAGDLALDHAIHIAKSSASEIILLHVIEDFPNVPVLSLHSSQAAKIKREFRITSYNVCYTKLLRDQ